VRLFHRRGTEPEIVVKLRRRRAVRRGLEGVAADNQRAVDESWKLILDFIKRRVDGAR